MTRRSPFRWPRLLLCAGLGLLTSVVGAWMIAILWPPLKPVWDVGWVESQGEVRAYVTAYLSRGFGSFRYGGTITARDPGVTVSNPPTNVPDWVRPLVLPWITGVEPWPAMGFSTREVMTCGWPVPCLMEMTAYCETPDESEALIRRGWQPATTVDFTRGRFKTGGTSSLPFYPRWPGLLINTAAYASAWWLLFTAPGIARRALRRRRGACARCGYDLRSLPAGSPCPECGTAEAR